MATKVTIALVSDTGGSTTDRVTSNPAVKGAGKPNTLVTIKNGDIVLGTTMADSTGAWSFTPTGLADGVYTLTATQAGLTGSNGKATLNFTLDRTVPTVSMALVSDTGASTTDKITTNPALKGTGQAGTQVTIKNGSIVLGTTMADSTGAWSFTPTGLADGVYTLTANQTDTAGNTGTATLSFTLDRTAPAVSIALVEDTGVSATDKITTNPAVKGTGQAGTLVTIKEGSTVLGTTMADSTGAWSFTPTGLAYGAHTLTASQTDIAGNTGTTVLNFTLENLRVNTMSSPALSIGLTSDTGASATDGITSNPALKGSGLANTIVTIREGSAILGTVRASSTGSWSFTPTGLAEGAHTLTATQTDPDGNAVTATLSLTLDKTAPAVSMMLASDTGPSAADKITSNPTIRGSGEANTLVTIKNGSTVLGTTMADSTGAWSFTPTSLADGARTLTASQTDLAGNTGTATLSFTLDRTAPVVSMALVADTGSSASDKVTSNPALKGTGEANTVVTIKEGDTILGTAVVDSTRAWSFTPTGLSDGAHTLTATQTDLAGNTGTTTLSFTLDQTAPAMSMALVADTGSSASDGITAKPAVKGTGEAGRVVTLKENGLVLGTATADSTGAWSFTLSNLVEGAHTLTASQTDLAGNTGTATLSFTLDKTAPAISMALVSDTGQSVTDKVTSDPTIKGIGEANTLVTIKEGGIVLGTTMADSTGAWSFTPTALASGVHALTASQTDLAGNVGATTLSFTLTAPPPSQAGDIVGMRLQNTGATLEQSGYVTFGQVFKPGAVRPDDNLVARIDGVDYAVQMDVKATNADGSVRHAVLTLKAPEIAAGSAVEIMLAKGSAAPPSPAAPSAAALLTNGYDLSVNLTFYNNDGTTATETVSAAAVLRAAIDANAVKNWLTGPAVNEYQVLTTVNGGKLKVEFDIRSYADGTTSTDVIFDNSWMFSSGKTTQLYDVTISQGGAQVYSANNVSQYLYSLWHHRVDSAGSINPNVQYDVSYLSEAAALPAYDQSFGVDTAAIQTDYGKLNPSISTGYGSTGPLGTAEVYTAMGTTGARPDIATQPNWVAQWVLSQDSAAYAVMMANADAAGGIPWNLVDESTGTLIRKDNYPNFFQDPRNTANSSWSPQPANGWLAYGTGGNPWKPDAAHMPDLNYVPYLISGSAYQLRLLQAAANYQITTTVPQYAYDSSNPVNPTNPGSAVYMGVASPRHQERAIAWGLREVAEAAYLTPDDDPLKGYFTTELVRTMDGLVKYYITNDAMSAYGDLRGFVLGNETASGVPIVAPWQQCYIVTALAEIAGMNLPQASDDAIQMLDYMTNFVAGLYTNGDNGYAPGNGAAYWLYLKDVNSGTPFSTWSGFSDGNIANKQLTGSPYGLTAANPQNISDVNPTYYLTGTQGGYGVVAKAALADLITYTQSPRAIEAYGYVVSQIALAWGNNTAGMVAAYQDYPMWSVAPLLPNGHYLQANEIQVDTSNNGTVTLTAGGDGSLLSVVGQGTATLTGGDGVDLLFGGGGPTTLIGGAGNDYLFAGKGATTFIDGPGDDYMKAGSGADTFTFTDIASGHDTIAGFKVGVDVLQIAANLNGNGIASAADLVSGAGVVNGSTVLYLGPGHDVTLKGIDTPASLVNSIFLS
jgi:hypothetical protein